MQVVAQSIEALDEREAENAVPWMCKCCASTYSANVKAHSLQLTYKVNI